MPKSLSFEKSILDFKQLLAAKLMTGLAFFCIFGIPLSLSRWPEIGFQAIFVVHILVGIIVFACYFRPNKSNYIIDVFCVVSLLTCMMIAGTFSFGLQSGATPFAVLCSFIIAFYWSIKAAVIYTVTWCGFLLSFAYLYINKILEQQVDTAVYSETYGAWLIAALGSSLTILFMLIISKQGYSYIFSLVTQIENQKRKIEALANTDNLTGCCSSRLTMPLLSQALKVANRDKHKVAVCFIDLNKFKSINDSLGHAVGDRVLQEVAYRIRKVLREVDITCRIGGDEFLIVLPKVHSRHEIEQIIHRIATVWHDDVVMQEHSIEVSGSIGIAIFPDDGESPEALRKNADTAMYYAKKQELRAAFYTSELGDEKELKLH